MVPPDRNSRIERILKRGKCLENDLTPEIWGLEAVFAVSFAYVVFYHCVLVACPFSVAARAF